MAKLKLHYINAEIVNPRHRICIMLIGCGGTGSHILKHLAQINIALIEIGHPGIKVIAYDNKKVNDFHPVRQLFSYADKGKYKSEVMINRINKFYGFDWEFRTKKWDYVVDGNYLTKLIISCVDTITARKRIFSAVRRDMYVLDIGNGKDYGQVILSTKHVSQPNSKHITIEKLKNMFELHDNVKPTSNAESCSVFDSINTQGLLTNSIMAAFGAEILWKMFIKKVISFNGVYVNLETMKTTPIPL